MNNKKALRCIRIHGNYRSYRQICNYKNWCIKLFDRAGITSNILQCIIHYFGDDSTWDKFNMGIYNSPQIIIVIYTAILTILIQNYQLQVAIIENYKR